MNLIPSYTLNMIKNPSIIENMYLMTSFHNVFLFPHFKYQQLGNDSAGSIPFFEARHILVRYFLMKE